MQFYIKKHNSGNKIVLAICDADILYTKLSDGVKCITVSEYFFKGELADEDKIKHEINNADSLNIAGNKAVEFLIKEGVVDADNVLTISNVKYAIVLREL